MMIPEKKIPRKTRRILTGRHTVSNEYELCYSRIKGRATDLYTDYVYGLVKTSDFVQLIGIFESNYMDTEADEVRKELEGYLAEDDEEVPED